MREINTLQARLEVAAKQPSSGIQATNVEARLKQLESTTPSPGVFMSAIHLHFAKLYFAAEARNWDLAYFERGEIVENLEVVAALRPEEGHVKLAGVIDAFKNTQLAALKDAIDMKDRNLFRSAYRDAINMCNACHQATGRPFIVITVPTNPPVANQQWELPSGDNKYPPLPTSNLDEKKLLPPPALPDRPEPDSVRHNDH